MPKRDPMLSMSMRERTQYKAKQAQEENKKKREETAQQERRRRKYTSEGAYTPTTKVDGSKAAEAKTTNQTTRAFAKKTSQLAGTKPAAKPAAKPKPKAEAPKPKPKPEASSSRSSAPESKPKPKPSYAVSKEEAAKIRESLPKITKTKKPKPKKRSGYTRQWER